MELIAKGFNLPINSVEEAIHLRVQQRERVIEFTKTLLIVNTIISAANSIASALAEDSSSPSNDNIKDMIESLRGLLLPEYAEDKEKKAERARKLLEEEEKKVYTIIKQGKSQAAEKGRVRIRRKS